MALRLLLEKVTRIFTTYKGHLFLLSILNYWNRIVKRPSCFKLPEESRISVSEGSFRKYLISSAFQVMKIKLPFLSSDI